MDLKLRLMEIFYASKDQDNFEREARTLHASMGDTVDPVWDKVVDMGKDLCPESSLFNEGVTPESVMSGAEGFTLPDEAPVPEPGDDMSLEFATTEYTQAPESPAQVIEAGKDNKLIDFDLGSFADTETTGAEKSAEGESGLDIEDMDLDFDLSTMGSGDDMGASVESVESCLACCCDSCALSSRCWAD